PEPVQVPTEGGYDKTTTSITTYSDGTVLKSTEIAHFFEDGVERKNSEGVNTVVKNTVHIEGANYFYLIFLIFIQVIYITLVYGPIAAFLVEIFPVKIRYTSMSLPYHIGNGIFGGLLPAVSTYLASNAKLSNNPTFYLEGLW